MLGHICHAFIHDAAPRVIMTALQAPQLTFVCSSITYPLLLYLYTRGDAEAGQLTQAREGISALHCSLVTLLTFFALRAPRKADGLEAPGRSAVRAEADGAYDHPMIAARSSFADSLTALETGYLLQDIGVLLYEAHVRSQGLRGRQSLPRAINTRVFLHHVGFGGALALLQWYISRGRARGVEIIVLFLRMNAS